MEKLRTWLVRKLLAYDHMVAVPEEWQAEFVKMGGDIVRSGQAVSELIGEYNKLLEDYFNKCNMKELKQMIKDAGIDNITADSDKDALVRIALEEYKMRKEK